MVAVSFDNWAQAVIIAIEGLSADTKDSLVAFLQDNIENLPSGELITDLAQEEGGQASLDGCYTRLRDEIIKLSSKRNWQDLELSAEPNDEALLLVWRAVYMHPSEGIEAYLRSSI